MRKTLKSIRIRLKEMDGLRNAVRVGTLQGKLFLIVQKAEL